MRETRDLNVSAKPLQSTRDSYTTPTSTNSNFEKSISGTTLPVETDISFDTGREIMHPQMPTDDQALQAPMALQDSIPDNFQAKNAHSTEFPEEREEDTAFSIIQEIQEHLQVVQNKFQRLYSLHKYKF